MRSLPHTVGQIDLYDKPVRIYLEPLPVCAISLARGVPPAAQYIRQGWSGTWVLAALIGMVVAARTKESAIDSAEELTLTA